jgi:bifunctional DNA-binding transcriptional regulator/antitoxin component of YhaV-PrlF toxin-antitoxin module
MRNRITLGVDWRLIMPTLTVTARGQVTFRKDVLKHLGIQPGGKVTLDLLPDGRAELKADQPRGSWRDLHGRLKGKGALVKLSIEEINDEIAKAGAAAGLSGLDEQ